ncbi:hypothetical protein JCM8547_000152 [Rhodosporidiobolus lusitaniae]
MQHKLLVANRGEIALRVLRSADDLDIPTLSVYTEADAGAPHVLRANEAVQIPNYLDADAIVKVCRDHGATMVHPGYGFLSENEDFAAKVEAAGVVFLGPTPNQISSMGLKHEARARAIAAEVPVLPGSELVETLEAALQQAEHVGWPIMLKATGGGGGRGTAVCWSAKELQDSFQSTLEMTETLFGGGLFVEKFIPKARHIEIQVFGDGKGGVIHAGERECSAQRRHQKVLEEAPSPFVDRHPHLGEAMYTAAVSLCKLINYRSAGTVEFLVDDSTAKFSFLELNSRIQVEHAVTEMVRPGLDLVGLMIRLGLSQAQGTAFELPVQSSVAAATGWAIEARIYAEVPHLDFKPSPGLLQEVHFPTAPWIRVDSWVETGSIVSPFYDPMVAKLIVHGTTREEARLRLDKALSRTVLLGTATNLAYLRTINNGPEFSTGNITTKFLDTFSYSIPCIEVADGGISTSVQDGRPRLPVGGDGIPRGGPMDELAARAGNLLVGNAAECESLEMVMAGATLKFTTATVVAVTGASAEVHLDEDKKPMWTRFVVPAGSTLEIGAAEGSGKSIYLAVKGGFPDVPLYLGSKSTFPPGKFGGVQGRDLVAGDIITLSPSSSPALTDSSDFTLPDLLLPSYPHDWFLAALPGPHADSDYLLPEDRATLYSTTLTVSADSNRLGLRLEGLPPLKYSRPDGGAGGSHPSNCVEHGYSVGAVNLNGDMPVLFNVDAPDAGGLICVLGVVASEWWKFGQLRPGDKIRFVEPSLTSLPDHRSRHEEWLASVASAIQTASRTSLISFPLDLPLFAQLKTDGLLNVVKDEGAPTLSFRQSGDGGVLVEVGEQKLDLFSRIFVELWYRRLLALSIEGVYTYIPCLASLLIKFDPKVVSQDRLLDLLLETCKGLGAESVQTSVPSRRLVLPVAFNDARSKEVIQRYMISTGRKKAVYLPDNLEYLAKANSLANSEQLIERFCSSDWVCTSRSFTMGLPVFVPLDKRAVLASQKYNPTRTYTPAGTLGYAGVGAAIYPVDSPGGMQILGRTLSSWSVGGRYGPGYEGHFLVRNFDVVRWQPVPEDEFSQIEKDFAAGTYTPTIEPVLLDAKEIAELTRSTAEEVEAREESNKANLAELAKYELDCVTEYQAELDQAKEAAAAATTTSKNGGGQGAGIALKSPILAAVRSIGVSVGDILTADTVPIKVEAMKTEIVIRAGRALVGKKVVAIVAKVGEVVKAGEALLYCL